jgi:hypothetical protein
MFGICHITRAQSSCILGCTKSCSQSGLNFELGVSGLLLLCVLPVYFLSHEAQVSKDLTLHQELNATEQELFTQLGLHFKVGVLCYFA